MEKTTFYTFLDKCYTYLLDQLANPSLHIQLAIILSSIVVSFIATKIIHKVFSARKEASNNQSKRRRTNIYPYLKPYVFYGIVIFALSFAEKFTELTGKNTIFISLVQTLAVVLVINRLLIHHIQNQAKRRFAQTLILPLALLFFMGWLDEISNFLDSFKMSVGNITLTLTAILKTTIFGTLLFWLGKASNSKGQSFIRNRKTLDLRSREVFAKLFEIGLYLVIFILMLEIIGIDYTTLAIFGGALGIGLGFGLQSIASNFISGIILLLDRSLSVGDHIELEDGQQGIVRALNMRSATVETYDGKDILVPNEKFISSTFINWTHQNTKQRYSLELQVAYDTDLHMLFDLIRKTISEHPKVLSGENYSFEEQPDAEIASFGDSGINILIEFWMDGVDDGKNRVGADLLLMIWDAFKAHQIQIPFPQREVKILNKESI